MTKNFPLQYYQNKQMLTGMLLIDTGEEARLYHVTGILLLPSEILFHTVGDVM